MPSKTNTFVKQAAILAIASLVVRFIGFLYRLPLTNLIGDEGNAYYSSGYYLYTFFLIISSAGFPIAISKMVSERVEKGQLRNAKKILITSLFVATCTGLLAALVMGLNAQALVNLEGSPESYYTVVTLAPALFIVAIISVFRGYFQGFNNTIPTAFSQIVEQIFNAIFSVLLAFIFIAETGDIAIAAAGGTIGTTLGAFAGLITIAIIYFCVSPRLNRKIISSGDNFKVESKKKIAVELMKTSIPIIVGMAIFSIVNLIDMEMVNNRLAASGAFTSDQIAVMYGQLTGKCVTITTLPVTIATALSVAAIPSIAANVVRKDHKAVNHKANVALRLTMLVAIPSAIGIAVLSNQLLYLLFPAYPAGGYLLSFDAISIIFLSLSQITTGMLQGTGYLKIPVLAALCGTVVKIILNYFLIVNPEINIMGAVISTIGCYLVASLINFISLKKCITLKTDYLGIFVKPLFAAVVMGLSCYVSYYFVLIFIPHQDLSCVIAIFVGVFVYIAFLLLIGGVKKSDINLIPGGRKFSSLLERMNLM